MTDYDDDLRQDQHDDYYRQKLLKVESDLEDMALDVAMSDALAALQSMAGWKTLMERLRGKERAEVERLRSLEMSPYKLGYTQGRLSMLRQLIQDKPLTEEDLAHREKRITLLRNERQMYLNLLS